MVSDLKPDLVRFLKRVQSGRPINIPALASRDKVIAIKRKPEAQRSPSDFFILQQRTFGGLGDVGAPRNDPATNSTLFTKRFPQYADRLKDMTILNWDYRRTMKRYDSPSTVHFLDPPYKTVEDKTSGSAYGKPLVSLQEMSDTVKGLEGKAIITLPNTPQTRHFFDHRPFHISKLPVPYTTQPKVHETRKELLVTNYNPRAEGVAG